MEFYNTYINSINTTDISGNRNTSFKIAKSSRNDSTFKSIFIEELKSLNMNLNSISDIFNHLNDESVSISTRINKGFSLHIPPGEFEKVDLNKQTKSHPYKTTFHNLPGKLVDLTF